MKQIVKILKGAFKSMKKIIFPHQNLHIEVPIKLIKRTLNNYVFIQLMHVNATLSNSVESKLFQKQLIFHIVFKIKYKKVQLKKYKRQLWLKYPQRKNQRYQDKN